MGFWDTITDLVEAATPWGVVEAEAPAAEEPKVDELVIVCFGSAAEPSSVANWRTTEDDLLELEQSLRTQRALQITRGI